MAPRILVLSLLASLMSTSAISGQTHFQRADSDGDGELQLTDAVFTLQFLFAAGDPPACMDAADSNDDGTVNLSDPVHSLQFLFSGGEAPPEPFDGCGTDGTDDDLSCASYPACPQPNPTPLVITEIMAANHDTLRDGLREFPDWIEVTNEGDEEIDLLGFSLTDRRSVPRLWTFHRGGETVLAPGASIVVFASGREEADFVDRNGRFHTNFSLDVDGEYLALIGLDGATPVHEIDRYPKQRTDVSWGLVHDVTSTHTVLRDDARVRWIAPTEEVPATWVTSAFEEDNWSDGRASLGYETSPTGLFRGKFRTDVNEAMRGQASSLLVRTTFEIEDPAAVSSFVFSIRHDDGFVAFLNGVQFASANAPGALAWNSAASEDREDTEAVGQFTRIDLSDRTELLSRGENLLAVQALTSSPDAERALLVLNIEADFAGSTTHYFADPTPGEPNEAGLFDFVRDTKFSVDRGYYDAPERVAITSATPGASIRFTTDGTSPTPTRGEIYSAPVELDGTTVLRAIAFRDGLVPTDVDTHTYIYLQGPGGVLAQGNRPAGYPRTWAGFPADYEMDPEIVEHEDYAETIADDLRSLPVLSIVAAPNDLFGSRGIYQNPQSSGVAWERPASMEFFDSEVGSVQANCGARIQGGAGRRPEYPKHAFRLIFRKQYGPGSLRFPFFADQPFGEQEADSYDKLSVRAGFNNTFPHWYDEQALRSQYVRDQWARDIQFEMGHRSTLGRYVHLYLNGMYWGVYNLGERPDDDFGQSHFGGDDADYDVIKNRNATAGNISQWSRLHSLVNGDVTNEARVEQIREICDFENLADYWIENIYFGNTDWDGHNWVSVAKRGGPFRFYAWDSEFAISLPPGGQPNNWPSILTINRTGVDNNNAPTRIFQRMRRNPEFLLMVADRAQRHLFNDGLLTPSVVTQLWDRRWEQVQRALVGESARWGDYRRDVSSSREPRSNFPLFTLNEHVMEHRQWLMEEYFPRRTDIVKQQLTSLRILGPTAAPEIAPFGGEFEGPQSVTIRARRGEVFFTVNGVDPRLPGGELSPDAMRVDGAGEGLILEGGGATRHLVPMDNSVDETWFRTDFDDAEWTAGAYPIGFDTADDYDELIATDVEETMFAVSSIYVRQEFSLESTPDADFIILGVRYDDGFVAYLNGEEIARGNAPDEVAFDSRARRPHSDSRAVEFEEFEITEHRELFRSGRNLLAVHAMNRRPGDRDFLIDVEIKGIEASSQTIEISSNATIRARTRVDDLWSPLSEATFEIDAGLRITEIMYNPSDASPEEIEAGFTDRDDFEFVEFTNLGSEPLPLRNSSVDRGIRFVFPETTLAPGERLVLVKSLAAFEARYGDSGESGIRTLAGYLGRLSNSRDSLIVVDPLGHRLIEIDYVDSWVPETDGAGHSLVPVDESAKPERRDPDAWRASASPFGSPGAPDA